MRFSPKRFASSMPSARTDGTTSLIRRNPSPPAFTASTTSSAVPRSTVAPRATPAAAASVSASSEGTAIVEYLELLPSRAALTSSSGIDVRVDQKLTTGTNGIERTPADGGGGGGPFGVGVDAGDAVGPLGAVPSVDAGEGVRVVVGTTGGVGGD